MAHQRFLASVDRRAGLDVCSRRSNGKHLLWM